MLHHTKLERIAMDKHFSLLSPFLSYEEKKRCEYDPWTIRLFEVVRNTSMLKASAFVNAYHFYPSLIFEDKAREPALHWGLHSILYFIKYSAHTSIVRTFILKWVLTEKK